MWVQGGNLSLAALKPEAIAMKFNFDAIFYYASDLDQAIKFYTDVLGFELQSRDYVARFLMGAFCIELVPTTDSCKVQVAAPLSPRVCDFCPD